MPRPSGCCAQQRERLPLPVSRATGFRSEGPRLLESLFGLGLLTGWKSGGAGGVAGVLGAEPLSLMPQPFPGEALLPGDDGQFGIFR